jgi:hypothetical protein
VTDQLVPKDVRDFLREHIESYEHLEILLLFQAHPEKSWSSNSVAAELHVPGTIAEEALRFLCREALLGVEVGARAIRFKYAPRSPELAAQVKGLLRAYSEQRIEIMTLMTANAVERLRTSALRKFSDSFLLGRKKNDDG